MKSSLDLMTLLVVVVVVVLLSVVVALLEPVVFIRGSAKGLVVPDMVGVDDSLSELIFILSASFFKIDFVSPLA